MNVLLKSTKFCAYIGCEVSRVFFFQHLREVYYAVLTGVSRDWPLGLLSRPHMKATDLLRPPLSGVF